MVGPDFLEKQTIHLLEVDSGLLKFIFTLTKPQYEGSVSRKKASIFILLIPENPTGDPFYSPKLTILCIEQYLDICFKWKCYMKIAPSFIKL